jgi:ParB family chromosome partitioning protein
MMASTNPSDSITSAVFSLSGKRLCAVISSRSSYSDGLANRKHWLPRVSFAPWERKPRALATADKLAEAVSLDMTGYWRPTVRTYLGRITKARILEAVREGVTVEAADQMANMKKQGMAEAAEQVLAGTGWLPALLRTARAAHRAAESLQADAVTEPKDTEAYSLAAE